MSTSVRCSRPGRTLRSIALGSLLLVTTFGLAPISDGEAAAKYRPAKITGKTYYVSPSGSDSASGLSPEQAWRTVRQANRAALAPGDGVLFRGESSFSDDVLMPEHSGRPGAPIVFGSYGGGRATLPEGVWTGTRSDLVFQGLRIAGPRQGVNGAGDRITVQGSSISDVGIAINTRGAGWAIRANAVDDTGDSGMILEGSGHRVERNRITDTGLDRSIPYGKHGIYMKASRTKVIYNTIKRFSAEGVSSRLRNGLVARNVISGGQVGIAWYQNDERAGRSRWSSNRISSVSQAGMYVSDADSAGRTAERFVIRGNVVRTRANFIDVDAPGRASLGCNVLRLGRKAKRFCSPAAIARLS